VVIKAANAKLAVMADIVVAESHSSQTAIVPSVPLRASEGILAKQVMELIDALHQSLIIIHLFIRTVMWWLWMMRCGVQTLQLEEVG